MPIQILPAIKVPISLLFFNHFTLTSILVSCRKHFIFLLVTSFQQVLSVDMRELTKLRLICKPRFGKSEVAKGSFFFCCYWHSYLVLIPIRWYTEKGKRGETKKIVLQWRQLSQISLPSSQVVRVTRLFSTWSNSFIRK